MANLEIRFEDLLAFNPDMSEAKANIMIKDALARAKQIAPFLALELEQDVADAASAIIRRAVLRWDSSGSGGITQKTQTVGPHSQSESFDSSNISKTMFFSHEIDELKALGPVKPQKGKAFSINMAPNASVPPRNLWW